MKLILCVLMMLISAKECDQHTTQASNETTSESSERQIQEGMKVTYQAATRGFFMRIWFEGDSIMISSDYSLEKIDTYPFPKDQRETFLNLLSDVDKNNLPDLEAPSNTSQFDAAQMAWLEISEGEESYKTMIFDHGNPPSAIKALVEKILSLKTMVEKQ
ncbi:hypothetical protein [Psychroserpens sp. MEBiC05023]